MAIRLAADTIPQHQIDMLANWLESGPKLTRGELVEQFEQEFSEKINTKYSVYVNSGSSANLLMLSYLKFCNKFDVKNNIVVPALSWATDVAPIIQLGYDPIFVDCNGLGIDLNQLEYLFKKYKPLAFLYVSVLGFTHDLPEVKDLCDKYDVILLEDNCESLGSTGIGQFGKMSSYSFYFGHHISTIEGGMVCTNSKSVHNNLLMLHAHGWTRNCPQNWQEMCKNLFNVDDFNERFTFYVPGYNLRGTEIGAYLGILQLDLLDDYCRVRDRNWKIWQKLIPEEFTFTPPNLDMRISNFALPLTNLKNRNKVVELCLENDIECRPLIAGSMPKQPMVTSFVKDVFYTPNADKLHETGMYLPNHHQISEKDVRFMAEIVMKGLE